MGSRIKFILSQKDIKENNEYLRAPCTSIIEALSFFVYLRNVHCETCAKLLR
jgi:hypothetical protein